jgi:drug/metabolite transporter (DMT)-like permease
MSGAAAERATAAARPLGGETGAVAAMVGATMLWGGTFVPIRDLVRAMPPQALVCGRFTVAAILFALVALARRRAPNSLELRVGLGNGVLMVASFYLQALGLRSTSAGSSAFLTCAGSLFAAFWAWIFLRERPGRELFAGIALALAGSALMSLDRSLHLGKGELITLAGATLYALQIVWIARHGAALDALAVVGVQTATVALLAAPFSGSLPAALAALPARGWADFGYLAVAGSSVAPLLQVIAQRRLSAGRVGLLFALEPVFALVCALTLGGERFIARWWWGAGLILVAVVLVEWRAAATARRASD